ncbi:MAG: hypothetical protein R6V20_08380 [Desulfobia sp.]
MKIHLLILGAALILVKAWNLDISPWYRSFSKYISNHYLLLNISVILLILALVFLVVFLNNSGIITTLRIVNKGLIEISLFSLNLISFGSLYSALWLQKNIWPDFLPIIALPVLGVLASMLCINIIDFNHPVKSGIVSSILIAFASFFGVGLIMV